MRRVHSKPQANKCVCVCVPVCVCRGVKDQLFSGPGRTSLRLLHPPTLSAEDPPQEARPKNPLSSPPLPSALRCSRG